MDKNNLKARWNQFDMSLLRGRILGNIFLKKELKETEGLLYTDEGKIDLRGLAFPEPSEVGEWKSLTIAKDAFRIVNCALENVDLSFCNLRYAWIDRARIKSCLFQDSDLSETKVEGCEIIETVFTCSKFKDAVFRPSQGKADELLKNVIFDGCDLTKLSFGTIRIEDCHFKDCKFSETISSARLSNTRFVGRIENILFLGFPWGTQHQSLLDRIFAPGPPRKKWNKMLNVDFSKAVFGDVLFDNGIDLSTTTFPVQNNYLKITNLHKVYQKVREIVASGWPSPYKETALLIIDKFYAGKEKEEMEIDYIALDTAIPDMPRDFNNKFFGLVKEVNDGILADGTADRAMEK